MTGIHTIISLGAGDSLVAFLSGAVSTTQPEFISSWVDTTTPNVPGRRFGAFNDTTEIELVTAPSSEWRQVDGLTVYNGDTAAAEVTVQIANGATRRTLAVLSLAVGETWFPLVQRFGAKGDAGAAGADGATGDDGAPGPPGDGGDGDGDDSWWVGAGAAASAQAASQPLNTLLTAIAALATTGLMAVTGAGTTALRTITGTANQVIVGNGDGVAGNPTLSLPQDIHTGASPTFAAVTATTFTGALAGNATTATTATNATNSAITDDTSTNATMYPVWVTAATGNLPLKVSSTDLTWNPSTNTFALTGGPYTNTQAVAATSTDGLVLATSATATSGNQKWSPRDRQRGSVWETTGGTAQTLDFVREVVPTQGATAGGAQIISTSVNGAAYANLIGFKHGAGLVLYNNGTVSSPSILFNSSAGGNETGFAYTTWNVHTIAQQTKVLTTGFNVLRVCRDTLIGWGGQFDSSATPDLYLARDAAASLRLGAAAANPPIAQTLSVQDASGTDIAGAAWTLRASRGTGAGTPGTILFQTSSVLASGTTLQTATTRLTISDLAITAAIPITGQLSVRAQSVVSSASITPSPDTDDFVKVTALAVDATFNNPTPVVNLNDGQKLVIRITDNGVSRNLTWDTQYRSVGATLPATTTAGKTTYLGFMWNSTDSKWDLLSLATTP